MEANKKIGLLFLAGGLLLLTFLVFFFIQLYDADKNTEREMRMNDSLQQMHNHQH